MIVRIAYREDHDQTALSEAVWTVCLGRQLVFEMLEYLLKFNSFIPNRTVHAQCYSLLRRFLCFTTNQSAQKFKCLANLIIYCVNSCNIYGIR